jgi:uncharacterized protein (TIGR01777 family)
VRVLISGASGLLGSAIGRAFETGGAVVTRLVRSGAAGENRILWEPGQLLTLPSRFDAVVHLAGESVVGRWTEAKKARIRASRVLGTRTLAEAVTRMQSPPRVLMAASATGFYGDRGDEVLHEGSAPGTGFLAEVCREWESASDPVERAGVRVVHIRTGVVLSRHGGALGSMLLPFRLGLGGRLGNGRQWLSWIHVDDFVAAVQHVLRSDSARGPVNLVGPNPVPNSEFTAALGKALSRPTILSAPAFALRLAFGEMADEALLASQRVRPDRLLASGYEFRFPELGAALANILNQPGELPATPAT